jgi:hypothetical protein
MDEIKKTNKKKIWVVEWWFFKKYIQLKKNLKNKSSQLGSTY